MEGGRSGEVIAGLLAVSQQFRRQGVGRYLLEVHVVCAHPTLAAPRLFATVPFT